MTKTTHSMVEKPAGLAVQDILPAFRDVKNYVRLGTRHAQKECAACRKPFNTVRKQHQGFRLHPSFVKTPMTFEYWICRACDIRYRAGGAGRDSVLAQVENFWLE